MIAETKLIEVTIEGQPQAKQRPRSGRAFGGERRVTYTPAQTKAAEEAIRWQLLAKQVKPLHGDVCVTLHFHVQTRVGHLIDMDNLEKLVLDACNKVAWNDDSQVVEKHTFLHRGPLRPRTILRIEELT